MTHLLTWLRAQWDRVAAVGLLVVGGILVVAGYFGVSGADRIDDQLSYLASGGIAGLFCLGLGASLLISANLGDEWRKLDELVRAARETDGVPAVDLADLSDTQMEASAAEADAVEANTVEANTVEANAVEVDTRVRTAGSTAT